MWQVLAMVACSQKCRRCLGGQRHHGRALGSSPTILTAQPKIASRTGVTLTPSFGCRLCPDG